MRCDTYKNQPKRPTPQKPMWPLHHLHQPRLDRLHQRLLPRCILHNPAVDNRNHCQYSKLKISQSSIVNNWAPPPLNNVQGATSAAAVPAAAASTANLSATHPIDEYELLCCWVLCQAGEICVCLIAAEEADGEGIADVFSIVILTYKRKKQQKKRKEGKIIKKPPKGTRESQERK